MKKRTTEEFKKLVYDLVGDEYTVLGEYMTTLTKIQMRHNKCGTEFTPTPARFLEGTRCPKCRSSHQPKSEEKFISELPQGYTLVGDYVNSKTKGVFTVASSTTGNMGVDFSQEQEYTALFLTDKDRTELDKDTYCPKVDGVDFSKPVYERDAVQVGGELILPPGETQYFYSVKLKQFLNGSWKYNELLNIPLVMPEGETFSPGNQYNVKLSVYGIQEVRTEVTLTPWIFGGSIIIDPDKDFENRNNF